MILTPEELRRHVTTDKDDDVLEDMILAVEKTIKRHTNNSFTRILAEDGGKWPEDIKMGVVKLIKWDLGTGKKVGIASETISRHSVTFESMTDDNSKGGYPDSLMGFLKPYMRARFGQKDVLA